DTLAPLTTVPIALAEQLGIPFAGGRHAESGAAGGRPTSGVVAPLWFSLAPLPQWQFQAACSFTTEELPHPRLALTDVLRHFLLSLDALAVVLRPRADHGGQPRPQHEGASDPKQQDGAATSRRKPRHGSGHVTASLEGQPQAKTVDEQQLEVPRNEPSL